MSDYDRIQEIGETLKQQAETAAQYNRRTGWQAPSITSIIILFFVMAVLIVIISIVPIFEMIVYHGDLVENQQRILKLERLNRQQLYR